MAWKTDENGDYLPPTSPGELEEFLSDPLARICSGFLYKIMIKSPDDETQVTILPFRPNPAQRRTIANLWFRTIIPKARQQGFTTLISILWLDHALFVPNQRCGIIAHTEDDAFIIFRDKVKFAYENMPEEVRALFGKTRDAGDELLFAHNNSSIRVSTSMRSGTLHRLLVSEFGKICKEFPKKAREVITGSLPAVPDDGVAIIESTAEGRGGPFYKMVKAAEEKAETGKPLTHMDYRLLFSPWFDTPEYAMPAEGVIITPEDHKYFAGVEAIAKTRISLEQRAWYVLKRDTQFAGDGDMMKQEYPSTTKELFNQSVAGAYYANQLSLARIQGRICAVPVLAYVPINTFWDIGASDGTAIWLHQKVGAEHRFIGFIEGWGESYSYFVKELQAFAAKHRDVVWGTHYLPHDAQHKRQQGLRVAAPIDMLREVAPGWHFTIVPAVDDIQHGIDKTRMMFGQAWFDETECKNGIEHLSMYRKAWNQQVQHFTDRPLKDEHTEAADALRQWAQGWSDPSTPAGSRPRRRRIGAMAA